jgi:3-hydroxy acid dehydrogenase / malonic semialdehyde reductase
MKVLLTGASSGIGEAILHELQADGHEVIDPTRDELDLNDPIQVSEYASTDIPLEDFDILINNAGHDHGGKTPFSLQQPHDVQSIMQVNLLAPIALTQSVLKHNTVATIVNITSMNVRRYPPNDLAYTLSKKSLHEFTELLRTEHREARFIEIRPGLVKTGFNKARFYDRRESFDDGLYSNPHMMPIDVARTVMNALNDPNMNVVELEPSN